MIISGKAVEYNCYDDKDGDLIRPRAFDEYLSANQKIPLCFQHQKHLVIGETVSFEADETGLNTVSRLHDSNAGKYVQKLVGAGVLDSFSICYHFDANKYTNHTPQGFYRPRRFDDIIDMVELSIVVMPAFKGCVMTGKKHKSLETLEETVKRLEGFIGIGWIGKEADEINSILTAKYQQYRDRLYYPTLNQSRWQPIQMF